MKTINKVGNYIVLAVILVVLLLIATHFKSIFPALNHNGTVISESKTNKPIDIPSNLNFLNDDKKAFLEYCDSLYGDALPFAIDNDKFCYYGTVDGQRLYRLQATLIPYEHANLTEDLGGYKFYSDCIYRPSKIGLYIITDNSIKTLENAYHDGSVNISDVYKLYLSKTSSANYGSAKESSSISILKN